MTFGIVNSLSVSVCEDAEEAVKRGHVYTTGFTPLEISKVVVIQNGTEEGNPTVDLVMCDKDGKEYVMAMTGRLLKSIPC